MQSGCLVQCVTCLVVINAWPYVWKDVEVRLKEGVVSHHVRQDEDYHL